MHPKTLQSFHNALDEYLGKPLHPYVVKKLEQLPIDAIDDLRLERRVDRFNRFLDLGEPDDNCLTEMVGLLDLNDIEDLANPSEILADSFNEILTGKNMASRLKIGFDAGGNAYWYIKLHPDEEVWIQDRLNTHYDGIHYLIEEIDHKEERE